MLLFTGLLALTFFLTGIAYGILKTQKKQSRKIYAIKSHCFIGYFALIIGVFHSILANSSIKFTFGFLSLFLLFLSTVSGMLLKYSKPTPYKRHIHIIICILTSLAILFHIYSKLLF